MLVKLHYGQVEDALARLHKVTDTGRGAFRARLRHLRQMQFPPGTNTGKGQRAEYSLIHYLQFIVALELSQAGFAPQRIVSLITNNWNEIEHVFMLALTPDEALEQWEGSPGGDLAIVLHPQALQTVIDPNAKLELERVHWLPVDELPYMLRQRSLNGPGESWRSLVILARPLLGEALQSLHAIIPAIPAISFWEDLREARAKRSKEAGSTINAIFGNNDLDA